MDDVLRVLYVDDEPGLLEISKLFLEQSGDFTVTTALDGPEAIRLLEQEKFDAIISDYQLPGMDGIQLLTEVRAHFGTIPFILFTGRGCEEVVIEALNAGADFYLYKGGDPVTQFAGLSQKIKQAAFRNQALVALAGSEARYKTLVENIPQKIFIKDLDYRYTSVNKKFAQDLGIQPWELVGKTDTDLFPADLAARYHAEDVRVMETGQTGEFRERYVVEGKEIWVHTIKTAVRGTDSEIDGILGILWDITDRKLAEDSLFRVTQKINVLSQLTQKDLASQILVLDSYLELAITQLAGQGQVIETIQKCAEAVRSIHATIEFSKDYHEMVTKPQQWQNVKMVFLLGLSHISISGVQYRIETENLEVYADPLLETVCQRLFENSVEHGGHVTRVRVWHRFTPGGVTITFEDNGTGIPHEKKEQIFLRSEGSARATVGSLIFVREILDITGITINETGEPGKGARFEMQVPNGTWRVAGNGV